MEREFEETVGGETVRFSHSEFALVVQPLQPVDSLNAIEFTHKFRRRGKIRDIKSFTFVAREDISRKKMSRIGAALTEVRYCRLINPQGTFLFTFWMTAGGKVADWMGMKE